MPKIEGEIDDVHVEKGEYEGDEGEVRKKTCPCQIRVTKLLSDNTMCRRYSHFLCINLDLDLVKIF